jgi:hypothetical protein
MNINNDREKLNEEFITTVHKRVEKDIKKSPDESYKDEVDSFILNIKPILDINKVIFKSNSYENSEGKVIQLKEYLMGGLEKLVTQFKYPLKTNGKEEKVNRSIHSEGPTADHLIASETNKTTKKDRCLLFRCFGKKAKYTELKPLEQVMHELKDNNSQVMLKEDFNNDIKKSPVLKVKSSKKVGSLLTLLDNHNYSDLGIYRHRRMNIGLHVVKDIVNLINSLNKQGCRSIMHQYTFTNNNYAIVKDYIFLSEYFIRTNFDQLTKLKNIEHPILIKGSLYVPNLLYIRQAGVKNFELLDKPFTTATIFTQLLDNDSQHMEEYNRLIISQNIEFSETLGYDTIVINLCGLGHYSDKYITNLLSGYMNLLKKVGTGVNNILFVFDCNYDTFMGIYKVCDVPSMLSKYNLKVDIVISDEV